MPQWCIRFLIIDFLENDFRTYQGHYLMHQKPNLRISRLYPEKFLEGTPLLDLLPGSFFCFSLSQIGSLKTGWTSYFSKETRKSDKLLVNTQLLRLLQVSFLTRLIFLEKNI